MATWIKVKDRLPGVYELVKWRDEEGTERATKETVFQVSYVRPTTFENHEWLDESAPLPDEGVKNLKGKLTEIRNDLYDRLPAGDVNAWEYIQLIKDHLDVFDTYIDSIATIPSGIMVNIVEALEVYVFEIKNPSVRQGCDIVITKLRELIAAQPDSEIIEVVCTRCNATYQKHKSIPTTICGSCKMDNMIEDSTCLNASQPPAPSVGVLIEALTECAEYLNQHHFEQGKPVYPNSISATSILHKKVNEAITSFRNGEGQSEQEKLWDDFVIEFEALQRMEENTWEWNRKILSESYTLIKK